MRTLLVACSCLAASSLWGEISSARDTAGPDRIPVQRTKPAPATEPATSATAKSANEPAAPALEAQAASDGAASSAQPATDGEAERTDEAKRLYGLGAEAFAARRNAEAIRYFRKAAAIVPSPKLTYNIALAYEELGDTGRAIAEYRDYLGHETEAERAEEVRRRVGELERRLGETGVQLLSVTSEPRGAVVRLGTEPVGITPWIGEPPLGSHEVSVELPGYEVRRDRVLLAADRAYDLDVTLSPRQPAVSVTERAVPPRVQPLTWTFLGVGAGAVLGGVAFELSRAKSSERAGRSDPVEAAEARGAADAKQMASLLLLGSGTAFLIGGGVLLTLDLSVSDTKTPSSSDRLTSARINVPCASGFCGVVAEGSF